MTPKLYLACALILCGHVVAWYATYSQFIWEWCRENVIYLPLFFALPTSYLFIFGMKFAVEEMGEAWGPRLLGFGLSYLVFPFLTYWYFNESMFEAKTLVCVLLSFIIVAIQVFWK
jgi:hypothetical protein